MYGVLTLKYVQECVKKVFNNFPDVKLVLIYGSIVKYGFTSHAISIAIKVSDDIFNTLVDKIVIELAKELNIPEELIDIVNFDELNISDKFQILTNCVVALDRENEFNKLYHEYVIPYCKYLTDFSYFTSKFMYMLIPSKEYIFKRLSDVKNNIEFLRKLLQEDITEIVKNIDKLYVFERTLHKILELIFDICRYVILIKRIGIPIQYYEYPLILKNSGIMNEELANSLIKYAYIRDALVYLDVELDYTKIVKDIQELINNVVPKFIDWVNNLKLE